MEAISLQTDQKEKVIPDMHEKQKIHYSFAIFYR